MAEPRKRQVGVIVGRYKTKDMPASVKALFYAIQEQQSSEEIMNRWRDAHRETQGFECMVDGHVEELIEAMEIVDARSFTGEYKIELHFSKQMLPGNFAVAIERLFKVISKYRRNIKLPGMVYCLRAKQSAKLYHFFTGIYNNSHRGVEYTEPASLLTCPLYKEYEVGKIFGGIAQVLVDESMR